MQLKSTTDNNSRQGNNIEQAYILLRHCFYLLKKDQRPLSLVIAKLLVTEFPKIISETRLSELAKIKINLKPAQQAPKIILLPQKKEQNDAQDCSIVG